MKSLQRHIQSEYSLQKISYDTDLSLCTAQETFYRETEGRDCRKYVSTLWRNRNSDILNVEVSVFTVPLTERFKEFLNGLVLDN